MSRKAQTNLVFFSMYFVWGIIIILWFMHVSNLSGEITERVMFRIIDIHNLRPLLSILICVLSSVIVSLLSIKEGALDNIMVFYKFLLISEYWFNSFLLCEIQSAVVFHLEIPQISVRKLPAAIPCAHLVTVHETALCAFIMWVWWKTVLSNRCLESHALRILACTGFFLKASPRNRRMKVQCFLNIHIIGIYIHIGPYIPTDAHCI